MRISAPVASLSQRQQMLQQPVRLIWLDAFARPATHGKGKDDHDLVGMRRVRNCDFGGIHMVKIPDALFTGQGHRQRRAGPAHLFR